MVGTALLKNNLSANSAHYITGIITLTAIHLKPILRSWYCRQDEKYYAHIRKFGFLFQLHMNFQ